MFEYLKDNSILDNARSNGKILKSCLKLLAELVKKTPFEKELEFFNACEIYTETQSTVVKWVETVFEEPSQDVVDSVFGILTENAPDGYWFGVNEWEELGFWPNKGGENEMD